MDGNQAHHPAPFRRTGQAWAGSGRGDLNRPTLKHVSYVH
jgi:hypothetical protein